MNLKLIRKLGELFVQIRLNHDTSGLRKITWPLNNFLGKVDNSNLPFVPKIRYKPNAIEPLPDIFKKLDKIEINQKLFDTHPELLLNPYSHEIKSLKYSDSILRKVEPIEPQDIHKTGFEYIQSSNELRNLMQILKQRKEIKEISIDLEHHDHRSYLGFTCLMQISTRYKDYIIDAIKLRNELNILNEVFTDPSLVKVFHGAECDIIWLQKDFGIYIVNMFDTGQAGSLLKYPKTSLQFLIHKFCNIHLDKSASLQQADWRVRPLNKRLLDYARSDTHYLLYIYDNLKIKLIETDKSLILKCFENSNSLCTRVFKKPGRKQWDKYKFMDAKSIKVLNALDDLRDGVARELDESSEYILPKQCMITLARNLPTTMQDVVILCKNYDPKIDIKQIFHVLKKFK